MLLPSVTCFSFKSSYKSHPSLHCVVLFPSIVADHKMLTREADTESTMDNPLHDRSPNTGTIDGLPDPAGTVDNPMKTHGETGAMAPGAFLQLTVPTPDVEQYQPLSGLRVRRLDGPTTDDAMPRQQASKSGFAMLCGRQWQRERHVDTTLLGGVSYRKHDNYGSVSSGCGSDTSPMCDSESPASCDGSVSCKEYENTEGCVAVPVTVDTIGFCSDVSVAISPEIVHDVNTPEDQGGSPRNARSNTTTKRTMSPHRVTVLKKKMKTQMAEGLYLNDCVLENNPACRDSVPGQSSSSAEASPLSEEKVEPIANIISGCIWPAQLSCPVEDVLGIPLSTSSPIRNNRQTRPVSQM